MLHETDTQQRKKSLFVSIGVLPLLYFVSFYKENFDYLVGGDEKERDNENMQTRTEIISSSSTDEGWKWLSVSKIRKGGLII